MVPDPIILHELEHQSKQTWSWKPNEILRSYKVLQNDFKNVKKHPLGPFRILCPNPCTKHYLQITIWTPKEGTETNHFAWPWISFQAHLITATKRDLAFLQSIAKWLQKLSNNSLGRNSRILFPTLALSPNFHFEFGPQQMPTNQIILYELQHQYKLTWSQQTKEIVRSCIVYQNDFKRCLKAA